MIEGIAAAAALLWLTAGFFTVRSAIRRRPRMIADRRLLYLLGVPLWPLVAYYTRELNDGKR